MRDHGGNIDAARKKWGDGDWIDLSTGINRCPYPIPDLPPEVWQMLPTKAQKDALVDLACRTYGTNAAGLAVAGAQAAIQMIPHLSKPGKARVLSPTYNEHAATLRFAGWGVEEVTELADLEGSDLAVVVNPNNPDGRRHRPDDLIALSQRVGRLVVDESFADPEPEISVLPRAGKNGLLVLRSFGKFWGLAGARLGFVFGGSDDVQTLSQAAGPWPISGAAIEIGRRALADKTWHQMTVERLALDATRLDGLVADAGWNCLGGTTLFRLYETDDALAAQDRLARHHIWSRVFPWSQGWLRLGLPGAEEEWKHLGEALKGQPGGIHER